MNCNVFYSWQSDLPNSTNRGLIQAALEGAAEDLKQDDEIVVEPVIDRDTAGVAGSPDIGVTIFAKIDRAVAFVCDVSLVTADRAGRLTPNPNVLVELGYAMKALGHGKIVMVMNTAFGGPEKLPFDLKQKRVITYTLEESGDKAAARKVLRSRLAGAVKDILRDHQTSTAGAPVYTPSVAEKAIEAIQGGRPDQGPAVARYMATLAEDLKKLDPRDLPGEADENLVQAIDKTAPLIDDFARVTQTAAEMNSRPAALALFKGLEHVLALYQMPSGVGGSWRETDFDLFKFGGHELCTILFALLMRTGRWDLIDAVASESLYLKHPTAGPKHVGAAFLSENLALLDDIRSRRTGDRTGRRVSIHADILKDRHERTPPVGGVSWDELRAADLLLSLRTIKPEVAGWQHYWVPRTSVYVLSQTPRFLIDATTSSGARDLATALGEHDPQALRARVKAGLQRLQQRVAQMGGFPRFEDFDADQIATWAH